LNRVDRARARPGRTVGRAVSLREQLIKIGAKVVSRGRRVAFQIAEVALPRQMFAEILMLIARQRAPPASMNERSGQIGDRLRRQRRV
jgi:hypothetical protein